MFHSNAPKWIRTCLVVPCLAASLCFGMVGCGGGADDATSGDSETTAPAEDGADSDTEDTGSGTE